MPCPEHSPSKKEDEMVTIFVVDIEDENYLLYRRGRWCDFLTRIIMRMIVVLGMNDKMGERSFEHIIRMDKENDLWVHRWLLAWTRSFRDLWIRACSFFWLPSHHHSLPWLFVTCFHRVELVGREKMRRVGKSIMKSAEVLSRFWIMHSASFKRNVVQMMIITISWQKRWHYGNYQQRW